MKYKEINLITGGIEMTVTKQKKMNMIDLLKAEGLLNYIEKYKNQFGRLTFEKYDKIKNGFIIYGANNTDSDYQIVFNTYKRYIDKVYTPVCYVYSLYKREGSYGMFTHITGEKAPKNICWIGTALCEYAKENNPMNIDQIEE